MEIIKTVAEMQRFSETQRMQGRTISLVPTMGYFHEGHLHLMRMAKKVGDCVVVSLYVNPTQFAPTEDFAAYPRDFERDRTLAAGVGVDVIFNPDNHEMYPEGYQTYVEVLETTKNLCGISRPQFFRGVATVCTKLFNSVKPHTAIFGKKDFQQYVTIRRMVRDLNMDIDIVGMEIIREADGLAMSSRNIYLSPEERKSALSLSRSLAHADELYARGERNSSRILGEVKRIISESPHTRIDYAKICDAMTIGDVDRIEGESVLALAVWVGKTRLIDNRVFNSR
jgi:pantoate--beta-alanine ligase